MIAALFYLQFHSIVNRTVARLRRLRQPKYLLGGIVGAVYFYFYFLRFVFGSGKNSGFATGGVEPWLMELIGGFVLCLIVVLAWIVPHQRAALAFTETEVAFLFPAPISRRGLIHFKLLRSQAAILFSVLIFTLIFHRFGGRTWTHAVGWWLMLSLLNLHLLASSFGRSMLLDRGISTWQRRIAVLAILGALLVGVMVWARRTIPAFDVREFTNWQVAREYLHHLSQSGPLPYVLYPFRIVVRPMFAPDAISFLRVFGPALLLLLAHYVWVIRCDVAFEEASVEASRKLAEKIGAMRAGNWQQTRSKPKQRRAPFHLQPSGSPVIALLWKNLIATGNVLTARTWIVLGIVFVVFCSTAGGGLGRTHVGMLISMLCGMFLLWSLILGPQILRQDFRQDLPLTDVLKALPIKGWQLALGQLLAPAVVLTSLHWVLLLAGSVAFVQSADGNVPRTLTIALAVSAAMLLPFLNVLVMQIPNAAVLLLPAWFQAGKDAPHGIEATGQRLILVLGQLLAFLAALLPAAMVCALAFFLGRLVLPVPIAVVMASAAAAVIICIEAALGVLLLGKIFDRFDLSHEL